MAVEEGGGGSAEPEKTSGDEHSVANELAGVIEIGDEMQAGNQLVPIPCLTGD